MPSSRLRIHRITLLVLFALLTSCSAAQLAYDNADLWLVYRANAYMDLGGGQSDRARVLARETLERHRRQELPRWMLGARDLAAALENGLSVAEVACVQDEVLSLFKGTASVLAVFASGVMVDLDAAQRAALAEGVAEDDERFRERFLQQDIEERMRHREERVQDFIEYWAGELLAGQRAWVARNVRSYPSMSHRWGEYHARERQRLLGLVDAGTGGDALREFIATWWSGDADQSPGFLDAVDRSRAGMRAFTVGFDGILKSYQRDRIRSRLLSVANDMEELLPADAVLPQAPECPEPAQVDT